MKFRGSWAERLPINWKNYDDDGFSLFLLAFVTVLSSVVIGSVVDGITDSDATGIYAALGIFLTGLFFGIAPLFSALNGMNNTDAKVKFSPNAYRRFGSADLVREIMSLPKEDQRMFPANLVETLRKDMHPDARRELNIEIRNTLAAIDERDEKRREAEQRAVYTGGIKELLQDSQSSIKVETETLDEYLRS